MAKINLEGKIIFYQYNKPRIDFELNDCKLAEDKRDYVKKKEYSEKYFLINGFKKDKYIILIKSGPLGEIHSYDTYSHYYISIYDADKINLLVLNNYDTFLYCRKIIDKYFIMVISEEGLFLW